MNSTGFNWNSEYLPNDYQVPSSPIPQKFNNLPPSYPLHTPVLIIHKSDDPRKKSFKETEEILPEFTLPGQLISIIRGNGGKAELNLILQKIEPLFPHLRRINGRKYSGKLMKTVIGGLHSTEIFQYDSLNKVWELKEDLAKKYERKTVEKFKVWQKKISKRKQAHEILPIKRKLKKPEDEKATASKKLYHDPTNSKGAEAQESESYHNLNSEGPQQQESSFNHAEFGNYLMNDANELQDFNKREEESIFDNSNMKNSEGSFPIMNQYHSLEEQTLSQMKTEEKSVRKRKRVYKRSYDKYNLAFKSLEKVVEYMMEKNYANLIKNPFTNLNGSESPEEIIQKIGTENIIGVVRCFDYFKPLIMENLEKKLKHRNLVTKGDAKKNFLVNVAKDVSDIKNKLNNIFNSKS